MAAQFSMPRSPYTLMPILKLLTAMKFILNRSTIKPNRLYGRDLLWSLMEYLIFIRVFTTGSENNFQECQPDLNYPLLLMYRQVQDLELLPLWLWLLSVLLPKC